MRVTSKSICIALEGLVGSVKITRFLGGQPRSIMIEVNGEPVLGGWKPEAESAPDQVATFIMTRVVPLRGKDIPGIRVRANRLEELLRKELF